MNTNVKVLALAVAGLIPASAFAQDVSQGAVAVALGASFQPVEMTSSVTLDGLSGMELTSVSVAAAAGRQAVASAVSNSNGRTGANSGASTEPGARLSAEVEMTRGGSYASEVLVRGGNFWPVN